MSLNAIDTRKEHEAYEKRDAHTRIAIDRAYQAAIKELKAANISISNDDRAEELIAAISYYVRRSQI